MLRTCQHLLRGTALQNTASTHQQHLIAKRQRIDPIMRDDNGGNADRAKKFGKLRTHVIARGRVQRGKRLVEEQQAGFSRENARQRDPLLLAPGEFTRPSMENIIDL